MGRRKPKPFIEKIKIEGVAAEGKAIARYNNVVVFVPFAVPGDVVDLQVTKKRKNYMEAKAVNFHELSAIREEPFCSHFGTCGGCKWQLLPYEEQLKFKHQQVMDALNRIGKIKLPELEYIMGSEKTQYYRNKLEYTFSTNRWLSKDEMDGEPKNMNALGFHIAGLFDKILDIDHCYLQPEPSNEIRLALRNFAMEQGYSFYNQRSNEGFLRNLVIRTASTGEVMLIVIFGYNEQNQIQETMNFLKDTFGERITSLQYIVNEKLNDTYNDLEVNLFSGKAYILEEMEGLKFKVGPKSFYQTNSDQAYELYKKVREFAGLTGNEVVYDLYTGTGTIACFVAKNAARVIGVEYVEDAVEDARHNATFNQIENTRFFAGDMKDVLNKDFIDMHGKADLIITDPPRAGMHASVIDAIKYCDPKKIVYVSCNPATQARDLELLDDVYEVLRVQPVDMFPHTHHVENIVLLAKRCE